MNRNDPCWFERTHSPVVARLPSRIMVEQMPSLATAGAMRLRPTCYRGTLTSILGVLAVPQRPRFLSRCLDTGNTE
jgi:hypothetical protein